MITREIIRRNLNNCLSDTSFLCLPNPIQGKVRDTYDLGDRVILVTTDRQSAFDRILACIPFKGQVLNQLSAFWYEQTRDIAPNAMLSLPDPNVMVAVNCRVIPVEFVVRGYMTGSTDTSIWVQYSRGARTFCGNKLPEGLTKNQRLERPILTPTTKAHSHDEPISAEEIVTRGIMDAHLLTEATRIVFALFERGSQIAARNGLILVDTKYELGIDRDGEVTLIDEIHTPDSSRFWVAQTYEERINNGLEPENLDKEFLRLWFRQHCDPYNDPVLPPAPPDLIAELSARYIDAYERITGKTFEIDTTTPIKERIRRNLAVYA